MAAAAAPVPARRSVRLWPGCRAVLSLSLIHICLQVDRCVIHRLLEMGLTPGTAVRVVQDAGGPMLLSVRGSRVALGRDLAEKLWVEVGVELPATAREIPFPLPITTD